MRFLPLLFLLLVACRLPAQTLTGTVLDENSQPLPGASVYLDGTSLGTTTDADGTFTLSASAAMNTSLIVSMIKYETLRVERPFEHPRYKFLLQPQLESLKDVVIVNDGFSQREKLQAFLREFFGETRAGKSCMLHNPEALQLSYNKKNHSLTATATQPLRFTNAYLGYEVLFTLADFYVSFSHRTLETPYVWSTYFAGTSSFTPVPSGKKDSVNHRRKTYAGSNLQLLRDLSRNRWSKEGFRIFRDKTLLDPDREFRIETVAEGFRINLSNGFDIKGPGIALSRYNLVFGKKTISTVAFHQETFLVDVWGNLADPQSVVFSGAMGRQRVGDLLPLDYVPEGL